MSECVFCRIARGETPARIAYQDEEVTAFHDLHPQAPVHILLIPNRHIAGVAQVEAEDEPLLGKLFGVARRLAEQMEIVEGYRLVINNGRGAGQSVFHLHVHLLGGRRLDWPPG